MFQIVDVMMCLKMILYILKRFIPMKNGPHSFHDFLRISCLTRNPKLWILNSTNPL